MIHILRPLLSRPVFADGGRLRGHSHRPHSSIYLLPRVPRSPTASLDPRNSLLLGAPFPVPSLVFLPLVRDGRHCGWHGAPRFLSLARCRQGLVMAPPRARMTNDRSTGVATKVKLAGIGTGRRLLGNKPHDAAYNADCALKKIWM